MAAYHLLRAQAWTTVLQTQHGHEVDLGVLRSGIADTLAALAGFEAVTRHTAGAKKSLDQLDSALSSLRSDLQGRLAATLQLLNKTTTAAAA